MWMMCYCCEVFSTKEGAYRSKKFADKLSAIVSENIRWKSVRDKPMIKGVIRIVSGCCLGCWISLNSLQFWSVVTSVYCLICIVLRKVQRYPLRQSQSVI